ncbi:TonB-dependent receptor domain-containing protein [Mariniflexile aquimaris]|uniref:TonB-dependent receptor domain-containing protein n=1 Tax=Mariniflexile aquimaris TaxID=881009 RepID=A0ABW3BUK4_9FLAO
MFKKFFSYFLFVISLSSYSQHHVLSGVVTDTNQNPISYSNVVVYNTVDLSFVAGTTSGDDGAFKFENLKPGSYTLKISYMGYEEARRFVNFDKSIRLATITLNELAETLDDVTVIAKRPTVTRLVDRTVFDVENSTLSNTNVLDVLKHTPGVLVHNESITIKNSVPTIYINDRKVHLSMSDVQQLLEGTSSTNIKSIEVITNPPAKYEAEGGSVINIITSKSILPGYNGNVFGNFKQGSEYPKYAFGTSHFFKDNKLNAYINYSINPRKDYRHNTEYVNFIENGQNITSWETDFQRTRETSNQNINGNIDYEVNKNNILSLSTSMLISPRENAKTYVNSNTGVFNSSNSLNYSFNTLNRMVDEIFNMAFTLDYVHKFKKEGEKLSLSGHHTNYDFSSYQDVNTGYFLPNNEVPFRENKFQTFASQLITLYTGQLDYELPIGSRASFEIGGKVSNISSESIINQFDFVNGEKTEDLENSDTFLYDEMNYAAYASFSKDWEQWSMKLGLRSEYTDITGTSLSTNAQNESDYLKHFPSVYVMHQLNENNQLYLSYNKRIYRPRYSDLNPFKYYLNDNTYRTGDPNLKPEIDDIYTLGYTFNKNYTFEAYYRYENDPTLEITFQDNDNNIIKYVNTNIDNNISYGLDFTTYTPVTNRWNIYVLSSVFYDENQFYALESDNELLKNEKWSFYGQVIHYFSFLKDKSLTADVSYLYIAPTVFGPTDVSERHGLDINFKKTLWNDKVTVSLGYFDVFNTQNFTTSTKYLNQDVFIKSRLENRLISFAFNYKFGNTHLKRNEKQIELEERDRLNPKSN